jgi:hypothetical protein
VTILFQSVTMAYSTLWWLKYVFYDDSKMMTLAATSLLTPPPRQLPCRCWHHSHVNYHVIADVCATLDANTINGSLWLKPRKICDQIGLSHVTNTVNGAVSNHDRREIMTKMGFHPWRHTNHHKITISSPMTKCDATIVTKYKWSQMNINDAYGVFSDVR